MFPPGRVNTGVGVMQGEPPPGPGGQRPVSSQPAPNQALAHRAVTGQHHWAPPALGGRGGTCWSQPGFHQEDNF